MRLHPDTADIIAWVVVPLLYIQCASTCLQALGKYGILRLHQKGQLQDIYSELRQSK